MERWTLEIAQGTGSGPQQVGAVPVPLLLAEGTTSVVSGLLTSIDPAALTNGFYQLRLSAEDVSGRTAVTETSLEVNSANKSQQYIRTETDLTVTLAGETVDILRTYDSQEQDRRRSFYSPHHKTFIS